MNQIYNLVCCILQKLSGKKAFLFIVYKVVVDYVSYVQVSVVYGYAYGYATPDYSKLFVSWIVYIICLSMLPFVTNATLKFAYGFFLIMSIAPSLMIYWLKDENSGAFWGIVVFWLIYGLLSIFISHTIKFSRKHVREERYILHSKNYLVVGVFLFLLSTTLFFSYKYGNFRLFVPFSDVYEYRMNTANYMSSIEAYLFSWNTNILLPICLIVHLKDRNYICSFFDIVVAFASYSIYGNKTFVFQVVYIIGVWIIDRLKLQEFTIRLITLCISGMGILGVAFGKTALGSLIVFFFYRVLYIPAEAHYFYFDFFKNSEKLYFRQSILRRFFSNPYENFASILIGTKYNKMGDYNNLNNGLFSDAYSNLGGCGIIVYPILIIAILAVFSKSLQYFDTSFNNAILIMFLMNLLSTPLTQNLLTGGMIIAIILLNFMKPRKMMIFDSA